VNGDLTDVEVPERHPVLDLRLVVVEQVVHAGSHHEALKSGKKLARLYNKAEIIFSFLTGASLFGAV
jgi:hypothetical protein